MGFRRVQDRLEKRTSRKFTKFLGFDYGIGMTDQADEFAYTSDFQFTNNKPWLRPGCIKGQPIGFTASITSLFAISIGPGSLVAFVEGGSLSVFPTDDILAGIRRYYTIEEVATGFTLTSLLSKTWDELITGNE